MERSIADAKAKLSELIRDAQNGGEVVITDRGRPVARLVPYKVEDPPTLEAQLAQLEARGVLKRASQRPDSPWPPAQPVKGALARFLKDRG